MFHITNSSGFHIKFANGCTVSVQFGPGNYCDNYNAGIGRDEERCGREGSSTAEVAVIDPNGQLIPHPAAALGDTVSNRSTPEEVLEVMNWAASHGWIGTEKTQEFFASRQEGRDE